VADNVPITAGSGTDIATDQVTTTGEHVQLFKIAISADGSRTLVPADATNGLLVDVSRVQGQVQIGDGTQAVAVDASQSDAEANTVNSLHVSSRGYGFNGTTWDRVRSAVSVGKGWQFTAAQTGTALWTPATGKALVITSLQIQSYGTTAGTAIVWFGGSADTTYTRNSSATSNTGDFAIFDGEFAPSATNKPGVYIAFPTPMRGTADFILRLTTTNAQSITVNVWGYEI
jgi:hypothetical protein